MEQLKGLFRSNKQAAQPTSAPTATGANGEKYALHGGQWVKQ